MLLLDSYVIQWGACILYTSYLFFIGNEMMQNDRFNRNKGQGREKAEWASLGAGVRDKCNGLIL